MAKLHQQALGGLLGFPFLHTKSKINKLHQCITSGKEIRKGHLGRAFPLPALTKDGKAEGRKEGYMRSHSTLLPPLQAIRPMHIASAGREAELGIEPQVEVEIAKCRRLNSNNQNETDLISRSE